MQNKDYHSVRLFEDKKRKVLWTVLTKYIQRYIAIDSRVLDFGAGYCDFINIINAKEKIAYDIWDGMRDFANPDVKTIVGDEDSWSKLEEISNLSLDVVFASNIFEHFKTEDLSQLIVLLSSKLKTNGRLIIVQPNFYYAYRHYFDDYTHKSIWSHISLADFLKVHGYATLECKPRFMPLTVKSKLPVHHLLIWAYLLSPIKPMAGQMFFVAEKV